MTVLKTWLHAGISRLTFRRVVCGISALACCCSIASAQCRENIGVFRDDDHSIIAVAFRYTSYSDPTATGQLSEHWQTTDYEILHLPDRKGDPLDELFTIPDDVEQRVEALITPPR